MIEQAVYVERSPTVGAFALVRWRDDGITIEVGPTSRRQRSLQWAVLIAALACSFGGTVALGPWSQPRLAFLLALLVGLALGILLLTVVARRSIAMDSAPSRELAERLLERLRPLSAAPE